MSEGGAEAVQSVSVSDARAAEGQAAEFTMSLSAASGEEVTVGDATSGGTAESETGFTTASGTLTFAANATSQTVPVETADDSADEENETFTLTLASSSGPRWTMGRRRAPSRTTTRRSKR